MGKSHWSLEKNEKKEIRKVDFSSQLMLYFSIFCFLFPDF